ncbi:MULTISPECIES: sugar ABC transporter ATP-binding protein [unclassified Gilliamella]|uniref:sugar ABC transporter ATP-binding protein n=1 Tax=unclassified Gilliamella TaxID=2685620 RepID=UPI00226AF20C|nr:MULTISPECIES: sugar ABC transporter ATP-binding protein [unclassified Gilliamella]MCX8601390.1 sugar ABC transporter ATP-binding protein [Gilliamella sp. B3722]MCX8608965.1 sugar ABC transporter ATP-binding protein [Gilliamella sp. B3771]MCX8610640.1 sugar ABC transporter ATP-binding protein [Gilliamella sp. B3891]MCX8613121.1 sugar ABC transporter ATP-binding protein [Gilliamella sp. B3773]MCX8615382.1 sugar ABC transporter ATP-binding protein [Gilliamella sp. B3770]
MEQVVLRLSHIEKKFAGVHALKDMHFNLKQCEVHGLLGENGAGKSTLIKIIGGIYKPDAGEIMIYGKTEIINGIKDAQLRGINVIHQEIVLVPYISIYENIFLGREPRTKLGFKDHRQMIVKAQIMMQSMGLTIDVLRPVHELTIAQQQLIEIIKAISFNVRILIMDEPTSSLTDKEVAQLFVMIKKLTEHNVSIIYISHRMDELFAITDRITVIRDGSYVDTVNTNETNIDELVKMMVGRHLNNYYQRHYQSNGQCLLEVKNFTKKGFFSDVNFKLKKGEILGFSGLMGAGRSEIMQAIFGADKYDSGEIYFDNKLVKINSPQDAIDIGIALIPEDRKKQGLILSHSIAFNLTLTVLQQFMHGCFVNQHKQKEMIQYYIKKLNIKTPSADKIVGQLSGGNQQKVVIAKWLATHPKVIILDEPTRGIDIGAKAEIYQIIDELCSSGIAIIMISSELPEIINMCDRVYVVANGQIQGELSHDELTQEKIMKLATGRA